MKKTKIMMSMPITIEVVDSPVKGETFDRVYGYLQKIENKFSVFKKTSEISQINQGKIEKKNYSREMKTVLKLSEKTKAETSGYFDIMINGKLNPSGLVKGWAVNKAANMLKREGFENFYIDAGGDIQAFGKNGNGQKWRVGIRNPFNIKEIVKVVGVSNKGVATSGTYIRGQHVYNPHEYGQPITDIVSLTVIGPNIYEADRFATAAFAMGAKGINFIEKLDGYEGYMIDSLGIATKTSGFERWVTKK